MHLKTGLGAAIAVASCNRSLSSSVACCNCAPAPGRADFLSNFMFYRLLCCSPWLKLRLVCDLLNSEQRKVISYRCAVGLGPGLGVRIPECG